MDTLIIGDLHGNAKLARAALNKNANIVFIGDYLDSFDFSREDQIETLRTVVEAAESQPDRVTALFGNHEWSYIDGTKRCSGWTWEGFALFQHSGLIERACEVLKPYTWVSGWLVSHAGVSDKLLKRLGKTYQEYLEDGEYFQVGRARGGSHQCGGLYWCDFWQEFVPVEGLKQVVGHSSYRPREFRDRGVVSSGKGDSMCYNIDCLMNTRHCLRINEQGKARISSI